MQKQNKTSSAITHKDFITAVVADPKGNIFDLDGYVAVGMAGSARVPLGFSDTLKIPFGSELMLLPQRIPVLYNLAQNRFETVSENPFVPGEPIFPVAAFNSPGYVLSFNSAFVERPQADELPLFSYGAVGWHKGHFRTAVIQVDREKRQDLRCMLPTEISDGIGRMRKQMPDNRLRVHLENCALKYGCPAAKNFFLGRFEAPLPTSEHCNARCLGCLSLQETDSIPASQDRICFTPSPEEIAQVALAHIGRVKKAVVSFGQGCEGDPLLTSDTICAAIKLIRKKTAHGTINMNTNASLPQRLKPVLDAGLDSIRVSLNSVQEACYQTYFRPRGYGFADVRASIQLAIERGKFVSINYLNCPGFSDHPQEAAALIAFIKQYSIHMIQWRNLNIDPLRYLDKMTAAQEPQDPIGMQQLLQKVKKIFPQLRCGYFNPPKESFAQKG